MNTPTRPTAKGEGSNDNGKDAPGTIGLRLTQVAQLFNSLDPSPFHEKDLDTDAERYIIESARELGSKRFQLVIELPKQECTTQVAREIRDSIRSYFSYRVEAERRNLKLELRRGWISLAIGLSFLGGCLLVRETVLSFGETSGINIISEGLLIMGWVAMWHPLEFFLYGWWPIIAACRVYARLASMDVVLRPIEA